jgi:hypothetical protein
MEVTSSNAASAALQSRVQERNRAQEYRAEQAQLQERVRQREEVRRQEPVVNTQGQATGRILNERA